MNTIVRNRTHSQEHLRDRLQTSLDTLRKSGYRVGAGSRFLRVLKEFERYADVAAGKASKDSLDWELLAQGAVDAYELSTITTCQTVMSKHPRELQDILSGTPRPRSDSRTYSRDLQFQLFVAANLSNMGLPIDLAEPDVRVECQGKTLGVAVKRIQSPEMLDERVQEACKQIERQSLTGVVALSLEQLVLNQEGVVIVGSDDNGATGDRLLDLAAEKVLSLVPGEHAQSLLGILLWVPVPTIIADSDAVGVSVSYATYYRRDHTDSDVAQVICMTEPPS